MFKKIIDFIIPDSSPDSSPNSSPKHKFVKHDDDINVVLYFTRHGHACSNFLAESSDTGMPFGKLIKIGIDARNSVLSDLGIIRSVNVGNQLKKIIPNDYVIMSSPLRRAIITSHLQYNIFREKKKQIHIIPNINEISNIGMYVKNYFVDTNSQNEYDLNDYWYYNNPYNIPLFFGNSKTNHKSKMQKDMYNPKPRKFFEFLLTNFDDYSQESKDIHGNHNFMITSHGIYMHELFKYLDIDENKFPHKIENNSVFILKMKLDRNVLLSDLTKKDFRIKLQESIIDFENVMKYEKTNLNMEWLEDAECLITCSKNERKFAQKYIIPENWQDLNNMVVDYIGSVQDNNERMKYFNFLCGKI